MPRLLGLLRSGTGLVSFSFDSFPRFFFFFALARSLATKPAKLRCPRTADIGFCFPINQ